MQVLANTLILGLAQINERHLLELPEYMTGTAIAGCSNGRIDPHNCMQLAEVRSLLKALTTINDSLFTTICGLSGIHLLLKPDSARSRIFLGCLLEPVDRSPRPCRGPQYTNVHSVTQCQFRNPQ